MKKILAKSFLIGGVLAIIVSPLLSCDGDSENDSTQNENEITNPVSLPDISGYPIVGTKQTTFYNQSNVISETQEGDDFYGQNANYLGNTPSYTDHEDGTITDEVTGLMWTKSPDLNGDGVIDVDDKLSYDESLEYVETFNLNGYTDWRVPTIKELYSLILFSGVDPSGYEGTSTDGLVPFIDTDYFEFAYGDTDAGERIIDAQFVTTTKYVDYTMNGDETVFGVNFADGRIKGYGLSLHGRDKTFNVYFVRGNTTYGENQFVDHQDGTITDKATDLMWMKTDSQKPMNWLEALEYAEYFEYNEHSDWRLPSVKELQSLVDYSRSPETTFSAAIDPLFESTKITNEAGEEDFPSYWSNTTHVNWSHMAATNAAYVSFGKSMGYMGEWMDVHGAGAQRSDPKMGDPSDYPTGHGPQGDAIRIYNHVRLVRNTN